MTTFTTEDREALERGLEFFKELKGETPHVEPIPFAGWMHTEDIVSMLREQLEVQNNEIIRLNERIKQLESQLYGGTTK